MPMWFAAWAFLLARHLAGFSIYGAHMKYQVTSEDLAHEVLRGELFNALHEAAPALVQTVASRLGVSLGALRKMAHEGRLTSAVLLGVSVTPR